MLISVFTLKMRLITQFRYYYCGILFAKPLFKNPHPRGNYYSTFFI